MDKGKNWKKRRCVWRYLCLFALTTGFLHAAQQQNEENWEKGLWLGLGYDKYGFISSESFPLEYYTPEHQGKNLYALFVRDDLFTQAKEDVGLKGSLLQDITVGEAKQIFNRVFALLSGKYVCSVVYTDTARKKQAHENDKIFHNSYRKYQNLPSFARNEVPKETDLIHVEVSSYFLHPIEKEKLVAVGGTVFFFVACASTCLVLISTRKSGHN